MNNKFNIGDFVYVVDCDKKTIERVEITRIIITKHNICYDVIAFSKDFGNYETRISEEYIAGTSSEGIELAKKYLLDQIKEFKILD